MSFERIDSQGEVIKEFRKKINKTGKEAIDKDTIRTMHRKLRTTFEV